MAMWSSSRSSVAMICARAIPDGDFKACCLASGRYGGANRNDYFQGVTVDGCCSPHGALAKCGSGGPGFRKGFIRATGLQQVAGRAGGGSALCGRGLRRLGNLMTEPFCFLDPFNNCLLGILHSFSSGFPVRHAAWQVWYPGQIPAAVILRKRANFNLVGWNRLHAFSSRILLIKPTRALM
jgi:hypothetical protein